MGFPFKSGVPDGQEAKSTLYEQQFKQFVRATAENNTPQDRTYYITMGIRPVLDQSIFKTKLGGFTTDFVQNKLTEVESLTDIDEYVEAVHAIFSDFFALARRFPDAVQAATKESFSAREGMNTCGDNFTYELSKDGAVMTMHLLPINMFGQHAANLSAVKGVLVSIEKDFFALATIVEQNDHIERIVAPSWIVEKAPALITRFGFKLTDVAGVAIAPRAALLAWQQTYLAKKD